jgi:acyl carrier protein
MAAEMDKRSQQRLRDQGWELLAPEDGLRTLEMLLDQGVAQIGVLPVNWSRFVEQFSTGSIPPFLAELVRPVAPRVPVEPASTQNQTLLQRLREVPAGERQELLMEYIEEEVARTLGLAYSRGSLDPYQGFTEMGMDSLMGVELRGRLQDSLGVSLPSTFAFDYSNIADVAAYLSMQLSDTSSMQSGTLSQEDAGTQAQGIEEVRLSEEELAPSVAEELAKLETALKEAQDT